MEGESLIVCKDCDKHDVCKFAQTLSEVYEKIFAHGRYGVAVTTMGFVTIENCIFFKGN